MSLTDVAIRNAKAGLRPTKMSDSDGLYLLVAVSGGKLWRFDYRFDDKRKTLALGSYPEISLRDARDRRDAARKQIANGIGPSEARKAQRASREESLGKSFEVIAREWYAKLASTWVASHGERILSRLERDIFPWLGKSPISEITIEAAGAHRVSRGSRNST